MITRRTIVGAGLALAATPALTAPARRFPREVLAFYYPWYANPTTSGRWFHWQGPNGEAPRQSPTVNHPTLGMYDSHDPRVIATHVAQAKAAGLTGLIVSWWGGDSFEDQALPAILDAAQRAGLKITVYLEQQKGGAAGAARDITYLRTKYARHPAWLGVRGRPVLFLYLQALRDLPAREWRRAAGNAFLVGDVSPREEADFAAWAPSMDGIHVYVLAPYVKGMKPAEMTRWADRTYPAWKRRIGEQLFCATVIPGFDDTLVPGRKSPRPTVARAEGGTYRALWDAAIRHEADWVLVTSFNEWHEGSEIEPSREHGDRYLQLTAAASRRFLAR
ncbi:endo-1,3-alpha-glucanase family glycosylhydrolase [Sphingomonas radiodurans]|uniref:endo-1,3-alpha-glucanase family glycosylhydrolase n=1 Tax=Sphingomonas radiodurans TaxID=2890321 RepID=UPI001E4CEEF9|nr:endo-1,3-alpha-glucanase family glycosylhydrolase [Sphingomonas radiodurans]WBH18083.1 endo-1,3-alpha-glucanase family glycosylhydrolase [Sphingomonas radiodurans]